MTSMLSQLVQAIILTGGFALLAHAVGPRYALRMNAVLLVVIALMLMAFPAIGARNGLLIELGTTTIGQVWGFWAPQAVRLFAAPDATWSCAAPTPRCCCTQEG